MVEASARELFEKNVHPRLLFGPDDTAGLRSKAQHGRAARALAEMLRRCERYTDSAAKEYVDQAAWSANTFAGEGRGKFVTAYDALHCLAFAHVLSGENRWVEKALALMRTIVRYGAGGGHVRATTVDGHLALAYDLLYNAMSEDDRRLGGDYIRNLGVESFQRHQLAHIRSYIWGLGTNMVLGDLEAYAASLAVTFQPATDGPLMAEVESLARRAIHLGLDEGGAIYEGPNYGIYDAEWLSLTAEFLRRMGVADLWATEPRFADMCRHWAYLVLPSERGVNPIGDASRINFGTHMWPLWSALIGARRLKDPTIQWVWDRVGGAWDHPRLGSAPECFQSHLGYLVLWDDESVASLRPDKAGWPSARSSGGFGVIAMRSGWEDDDVYFSLLAAGRTPGCPIHQHVDAGHFSLFALGEAFSVDSGYGDTLGRYHSVMMPHGREPAKAPDGWGQMDYGGRVAAFAPGTHADYACVNIGEQWECRWAFRHAMLVKAPGALPYVVLLDNFNHCGEFSDYLWLMNSEPGNSIELDGKDERAIVQGRVNRLELAWSYPRAEDYPLQHRVDLDSDEVDSWPLGHLTYDIDPHGGPHLRERPRGGGRLGMGVRPRLKATLWGYNGQLLSVLIPRRAQVAQLRTERLGAKGHFGIAVHLDGVTDTVVASPIDRWIDLGGIRGEATLAIARRDSTGRLVWWAAADAYALEADGKTLLPRQGAPAYLKEGQC